MKGLLVLVIGMILAGQIYCQNRPEGKFQFKNSAQLDLGGPGLFYSLNYERILINGDQFKTSSQIGISYYPASTGIRDIWIPMGINEVFFTGKHHLEAGLGYVLIREAVRDIENNPADWLWSNLIFGRLGYRFQKHDGHLIFRASFVPLIEYDSAIEFHPLGGISLGYSF